MTHNKNLVFVCLNWIGSKKVRVLVGFEKGAFERVYHLGSNRNRIIKGSYLKLIHRGEWNWLRRRSGWIGREKSEISVRWTRQDAGWKGERVEGARSTNGGKCLAHSRHAPGLSAGRLTSIIGRTLGTRLVVRLFWSRVDGTLFRWLANFEVFYYSLELCLGNRRIG